MTEAEALAELRRLHAEYKRQCGTRFAHCLFTARSVPGWVYNPLKDAIEAGPESRPTNTVSATD